MQFRLIVAALLLSCSSPLASLGQAPVQPPAEPLSQTRFAEFRDIVDRRAAQERVIAVLFPGEPSGAVSGVSLSLGPNSTLNATLQLGQEPPRSASASFRVLSVTAIESDPGHDINRDATPAKPRHALRVISGVLTSAERECVVAGVEMLVTHRAQCGTGAEITSSTYLPTAVAQRVEEAADLRKLIADRMAALGKPAQPTVSYFQKDNTCPCDADDKSRRARTQEGHITQLKNVLDNLQEDLETCACMSQPSMAGHCLHNALAAYVNSSSAQQERYLAMSTLDDNAAVKCRKLHACP